MGQLERIEESGDSAALSPGRVQAVGTLPSKRLSSQDGGGGAPLNSH